MADTSPVERPPAGQGGKQTPRDFAALSRRIALWTTNGLATALVLVAGLALGRQVLVWWREPPPQSFAGSQVQPPDGAAQQLEFGALATTVRTRPLRGNRAEIIEQLAHLCRPVSRPDTSADHPVSAAERKLLAELAGKTPLETGDGWRIDDLGEQMPLVVCSTWAGDKTLLRSSLRSGSEMKSVLPSPLDLRIVSIAMGIPADEGAWSAYAFDVSGHAAAAANDGPGLPADSRRVLTLRQDDGSVMTTFRGLAKPSVWEKHFAKPDPGSGWHLISAGESAGGRWQGEFTRPGEKPLRATVHFEYDGQGWLHGLSLVQPAREP